MASEAIPIDPVLLAEEAPPEAPRRHGDTMEIPVLNGASTQIGDTALARETPAAALPPTSSSPPPDASTYPPRQGETEADYEPPFGFTVLTRASLQDACNLQSAALRRLRPPGAQASQIGEFRKATFRARKVLLFLRLPWDPKGTWDCVGAHFGARRGRARSETRLLVCGGEFVDFGVCGRVDAVGGGGALDGRANVLRMGGAILEGGRGRAVAQDMILRGLLEAVLGELGLFLCEPLEITRVMF
ncbi:hypothetical protein B0H13DRAFT_1852029 [Mycena leptocephala]|nr:hypothetical protein B0H13DRAFT_1852029 [Mycena leptocephala]